MLDGMSDSIQGSRIENLQSREVDRQSPTGLIFNKRHVRMLQIGVFFSSISGVVCYRMIDWKKALNYWMKSLNFFIYSGAGTLPTWRWLAGHRYTKHNTEFCFNCLELNLSPLDNFCSTGDCSCRIRWQQNVSNDIVVYSRPVCEPLSQQNLGQCVFGLDFCVFFLLLTVVFFIFCCHHLQCSWAALSRVISIIRCYDLLERVW